MPEPLYEVPLRTAHVAVFADGTVTTFAEDGSQAVATVKAGDEEHVEAARHAGYGDDQYRMLVEHEIGHSFVADLLGWPHSWSLWSAAHGTGAKRPMGNWSPRVRDEEHLVVSLQRFVNTGREDEYGKLRESFGDDLALVARRFLSVARPWLEIPPH